MKNMLSMTLFSVSVLVSEYTRAWSHHLSELDTTKWMCQVCWRRHLLDPGVS